LVPVLVAGAVLLVAGGALMVTRTHSQATEEPPSSGSTQAPRDSKSNERQPEVARAAPPADDKNVAVVPVASPPTDRTGSGEPTSKTTSGASKTLKGRETGAARPPASSASKGTAAAPAATQEQKPPPAKKPASDDPFSKRF
jgi:hypothetical protein